LKDAQTIFRRITSGGNYVPEIDGLRFVAIAAVLMYHVGRLTEMHVHLYHAPANVLLAFCGRLLFNGARGVPVFFAISGFVLGIPFARQYLAGGKGVSLKQYFLRRVTRLEPPYVLSQSIRLYPLMVVKNLTFLQVLPHFLAGLLYLHLLIYRSYPLVQIVGWSLELEIQFYLLAPLLARLFFRSSPWQRRTLLYGFLLAHWALIYLFAGPTPGEWATGTLLQRYINLTILYWIRFFVAGLAVADLYVTVFPRMKAHWIWDVMGAPCLVLPFALGSGAWDFWGPWVLVVGFVGAFHGPVLRWFFRNAFVGIVGGMCYSLYLTHSIALQAFDLVYMKLLPGIHGFLARLVVGEILILPLLLVVGSIFYLLIERPCMDRNWPVKLRHWTRRKLAGAAAL